MSVNLIPHEVVIFIALLAPISQYILSHVSLVLISGSECVKIHQIHLLTIWSFQQFALIVIIERVAIFAVLALVVLLVVGETVLV